MPERGSDPVREAEVTVGQGSVSEGALLKPSGDSGYVSAGTFRGLSGVGGM